jgi:anti-sigma factor RsiW
VNADKPRGNARVVPLEPGLHDEVRSLLPWHASGTLSADETSRVEAHLAGCVSCRVALAWEQRLYAAHQASPPPAADVEGALARLRPRIEQGAHRRRIGSGLLARIAAEWQGSGALLRAMLVVQAMLLAGVFLLFDNARSVAGRYRALGDSDGAAHADAVVRFQPTASEEALRRALTASGARLVGGPTASGAYLLRLPAAREEAALQQLRADPAVQLAESLGPGALR